MPTDGKTTAAIRAATATDLDVVIALCAEHAEYEGASFVHKQRQAEALGRAMCAEAPRVWCPVVEADGMVAGYATYALEFSTWQAGDYMHVDCLYLKPQVRGAGIGADIMRRVAAHAALLGCAEIQWQTPPWNVEAVRFYDRLGATRVQKLRYRWTPKRRGDDD